MEARAVDRSITSDFDTTNPSIKDIKRKCLAHLVNAVYKLDRLKPDLSAASEWYEKFNFELKKILYIGSEIFGAVFVLFKSVVIAFRGTILSSCNDICDNVKLSLQKMREISRVKEALVVTRDMIKEYGSENVFLAGHSLGAAVALQVGRVMAREGHMLETHLFNPPFITLFPVNSLIIGVAIEKTRQSIAGLMSKGIKDHDDRAQSRKTFTDLRNWYPNLYVNKNDPISCNYVNYFEAAKNSSHAHESIINSLKYKKGEISEPHHLLPSATLFVNSSGKSGTHGLYQWWSEDSTFPPKEYGLDVKSLGNIMEKIVPS